MDVLLVRMSATAFRDLSLRRGSLNASRRSIPPFQVGFSGASVVAVCFGARPLGTLPSGPSGAVGASFGSRSTSLEVAARGYFSLRCSREPPREPSRRGRFWAGFDVAAPVFQLLRRPISTRWIGWFWSLWTASSRAVRTPPPWARPLAIRAFSPASAKLSRRRRFNGLLSDPQWGRSPHQGSWGYYDLGGTGSRQVQTPDVHYL